MGHGLYWMVAPGQDTKGLYLSSGTKEPRGRNVVPLKTIESNQPWDIGADVRHTEEHFESVRYFARITFVEVAHAGQ